MLGLPLLMKVEELPAEPKVELEQRRQGHDLQFRESWLAQLGLAAVPELLATVPRLVPLLHRALAIPFP